MLNVHNIVLEADASAVDHYALRVEIRGLTLDGALATIDRVRGRVAEVEFVPLAEELPPPKTTTIAAAVADAPAEPVKATARRSTRKEAAPNTDLIATAQAVEEAGNADLDARMEEAKAADAPKPEAAKPKLEVVKEAAGPKIPQQVLDAPRLKEVVSYYLDQKLDPEAIWATLKPLVAHIPTLANVVDPEARVKRIAEQYYEAP